MTRSSDRHTIPQPSPAMVPRLPTQRGMLRIRRDMPPITMVAMPKPAITVRDLTRAAAAIPAAAIRVVAATRVVAAEAVEPAGVPVATAR